MWMTNTQTKDFHTDSFILGIASICGS